MGGSHEVQVQSAKVHLKKRNYCLDSFLLLIVLKFSRVFLLQCLSNLGIWELTMKYFMLTKEGVLPFKPKGKREIFPSVEANLTNPHHSSSVAEWRLRFEMRIGDPDKIRSQSLP
jgi:hypothetical protein